MKKLFAIVLVCVLVMGMCVQASSFDTAKNPLIDKKLKQMEVIEKFQNNSNNLKIDWNAESGNPRFVTGRLSDSAVTNSADAAAFIDSNKALYGVKEGKFDIKKVEKDNLGMTHYRSMLTVDNIPVYGAELLMHTDANGDVVTMNGNVNVAPEKAWSREVRINAEKAVKAAVASLGNVETVAQPTAELYLNEINKEWQAAYLVRVIMDKPYAADMRIWVNAFSGKVVASRNEIKETATTGTGVGTLGQTRNLNLDLSGSTYSMKDSTRGNGVWTYTANNGSSTPGTVVTDTDNNFNSTAQKAAVDSHYYLGVTYDFYKNNFNRNSFDNAGAKIISTVHYGSSYNNAYWDGTQMVFGDGDGSTFISLSAALDVIAHEFTHAVTERTCNLVYQDQSGALNESMSDVFGYLIEGQATDWLMGEDIYTPNTPGDALRNIQDPTACGDPAHMNNYNYSTSDNGGVHTNSGIPNKAFYNAASVINDNAKMAQIYYKALTTYLTSSSQFADARTALIQSATDLYGASSAEVTAVTNAWTAVGVGGTTPPANNDTYEANNTTATAYGPLTSGTAYNSYIWSATDVDYYYFDITSTGTVAVSLTNLPKDYDVYLLNSAGTQVAKSENGSTTNESISYSATSTGRYYVKVAGYSSAYSTSTAYALTVTYPTGGTPTGQWYYETKAYDSPHSYANNYNGTNTYTKTGATKVQVHFSQFETESGYDFVYIKDKNGNTVSSYNGTKSAFWAAVDGDTINVNLVTDSSVTAYGYHIDQVAYYANGQLIVENVDINVGTQKTQDTTTYGKVIEKVERPAIIVSPEVGKGGKDFIDPEYAR